jgi:hypothetical protein
VTSFSNDFFSISYSTCLIALMPVNRIEKFEKNWANKRQLLGVDDCMQDFLASHNFYVN